MRYLIILSLSVALLIILEHREHKQSATKATTTTKTTISTKTQADKFTPQQHQAIKQAISGFGSKIVDGVATYTLPGGGKVSFRKGTFGDKFTSFLGVHPNKVGERFIFDNLEFSTGSANLSAYSLKEVAELAKVLKAFPKVHIHIEGHTDALGDPTKNIALSLARANAISNQLVASGINAYRFTRQGLGSAKPANESDPTAKENRRVEIVITKR